MDKEVMVVNPYGDAPVATVPQGTALVAVEQIRAMSEVKAAMTIAQEFPRNQQQAMTRILIACQREELAGKALYAYARGGTEITGPSIRLAEAIAKEWGNMQFGVRELEQRNGESTVEAYCWDMETNVRSSRVFQVKHERHTKKGSYALSDPRDIYELTANQGARRLRATILALIPGDVVEAAEAQCEATLKAKADNSPEALKRILDAFSAYSVTKAQIEARIQRNFESITPAQQVGLKKLLTSMKDGMSSPSDWFEMPVEQQVDPSASLKDKIKAAKSKTEPAAPVTNELPLGGAEREAGQEG
jgi:hypothetical protein